MASQTFPKFKQACLSGQVDLTTAVVKAAIIDLDDYTFNAAHEFLSDVTAAAPTAIIATSAALTGKSVTDGIFSASNPTISGVTGDQVEGVLVYIDTGTPATSRLISLNEFDAPVTPNGGSITVGFPSGVILS